VALIPMGTGNALANSSGITADNTLGLSTLARGTAVNLPTLRATFSSGARLLTQEAEVEEELSLKDEDERPIMYGAVVGSWGLHASLVADSDTAEYRKFGVERFGMAARENLYPTDGAGPHKYKARVSLSRPGSSSWTRLDRQEHAYVLATLVSNLEKGFTISPQSEALGGKLRVVHFGPLPGDEVMRLMTLAYQGGKHIAESEVSYEEIDGIRIEFDDLEDDARWRRICLDGKIVRLEKDGWVEIRPEKRSFLSLRHLKR
jgi:diacylglycerol kinase family enzyme